jgi:hypothetical protein
VYAIEETMFLSKLAGLFENSGCQPARRTTVPGAGRVGPFGVGPAESRSGADAHTPEDPKLWMDAMVKPD